ncbi:MAG: hypothetical protein RMM58_12150 [Chloroflexota bacterium]|nr:hypothetical protein [Dehalococcoidia bacterium]MDW8254619.1 hypothetical protein [Chloroflexota bacterium]
MVATAGRIFALGLAALTAAHVLFGGTGAAPRGVLTPGAISRGDEVVAPGAA